MYNLNIEQINLSIFESITECLQIHVLANPGWFYQNPIITSNMFFRAAAKRHARANEHVCEHFSETTRVRSVPSLPSDWHEAFVFGRNVLPLKRCSTINVFLHQDLCRRFTFFSEMGLWVSFSPWWLFGVTREDFSAYVCRGLPIITFVSCHGEWFVGIVLAYRFWFSEAMFIVPCNCKRRTKLTYRPQTSIKSQWWQSVSLSTVLTQLCLIKFGNQCCPMKER